MIFLVSKCGLSHITGYKQLDFFSFQYVSRAFGTFFNVFAVVQQLKEVITRYYCLISIGKENSFFYDPELTMDNTSSDPILTKNSIAYDPTQTVDIIHNPTQTMDNSVHGPVIIMDNHFYDSTQSVDNNLHDSTQSVDNNLHYTTQPVDNNLHDSTQSVDNNLHDSTQPVDNNLHYTTQPVDNNLHDSTQPMDNNLHDSTQPMDNNLHDSTQPVDNNLHYSTQPMDNNLHDSTQPMDNNLHDSTQPMDNNLHDSTQPMDNNLHDSTQPMDNNLHDSTQPMDNNLHDSTQPMDNNLHDSTQPMDNNLHDSTQPMDNNLHDSTQPMDNNLHDSTQPMDNNLHDSTQPVDNNLHDSTQPVDNNLHDSTQAVDNNFHDSTQAVDNNPHYSTPVDNNPHDSTQAVDNNLHDSTQPVDNNPHYSTQPVDNNLHDSTQPVDNHFHNSTRTMYSAIPDPALSMNNIPDPVTMDDSVPDPTLTVNTTARDQTLLMDISLNPNLSLREKLNAHIAKKKRHGVKPRAHIINKCAPWWYFVVAGGVAYWGITDTLPFLYRHWGGGILLANQLFGMMVFLEMAINWICIRKVDSTYIPSVHGTKQPELLENENSQTIMAKKRPNLHKYGIEESEECLKNENGDDMKPRKGQKVFKMYVATSLPDAYGNVERSVVPYWSWVACVVCQRLRPPRCHHCVLCNKCVLKRDHHCYFAQACIGVNNLRHFVVFLFWAFVGCLWSWLNMVPYLLMELLPNISYLDILTPCSFVRWVLGYQDFIVCFLTFLGWMLTVFLVFTGIQLADSVVLLLKGATSFEQDNDIMLTDSRTKRERLHAVFGHYWMLNFLFPCHMFFKPLENAVQWPNTKL